MTPHHLESSAVINAFAEDVFAFVDEHARFSSHMNESSWMMGGGRMSVDLDAAHGQAVGSHIRLSGRVFGIRLYLDEVVTRRDPPINKVWETVGVPRLLVIGAYKMGVEITPVRDGSRMRVFIDYELPKGWVNSWLGFLFGRFYAKWCIDRMLEGAVEKFATRYPAAA
jgi:Polyketide cyclase / dehydrase and lipid transport